MNDRRDTAEAFLSAALEERAGGHHPPDLTERILSRAGEPARRQSASRLAAATLLLGAGVLAAVYLLPNSTREDGANGQVQDPAPKTVIEPIDRADWRRLLADVRTISATVYMLPGARISTVGLGLPFPAEVVVAQQERAREIAGVLATLEPRGYDGPWQVSHTLWLNLGGQRAARLELQCTSRPWVARIPKLGFVVVETELKEVLQPEIALANRSTKAATGIVGADDVRGDRYEMIADDAEILRPHELDPGQLALVLHYRELRELDLRGSPSLYEPAILGRLSDLPKLEVVHLNAHWTEPEDVGALGGISSLTELRLAITRPVAASVETLPDGRVIVTGTLDGGVLEAVLGLSLGSVALPGEMITDQILERLCQSTTLRALDLTRLDPNVGSPESIRLARLASMKSLRRLVLDGWFAGGFGVTSFGLSTFEDTDGDGLPDAQVPSGGLDVGRRAALTKLACQSAVRDLSLRDCVGLGYDDIAGWKGAIDLDRLDLTGCRKFTIEQIRELRAASAGCEIVWDESSR